MRLSVDITHVTWCYTPNPSHRENGKFLHRHLTHLTAVPKSWVWHQRSLIIRSQASFHHNSYNTDNLKMTSSAKKTLVLSNVMILQWDITWYSSARPVDSSAASSWISWQREPARLEILAEERIKTNLTPATNMMDLSAPSNYLWCISLYFCLRTFLNANSCHISC